MFLERKRTMGFGDGGPETEHYRANVGSSDSFLEICSPSVINLRNRLWPVIGPVG